MADVVVAIGGFNDGQVIVEIVRDDVSLAIKRIQATNNSDYPCAIALRKMNILVREHIVAAHSSRGRNLPAGIAFVNVLDEGNDADGNPLGYNISLGDIEIRCRWPA